MQSIKIGADTIELFKQGKIYHVKRLSDSVCGRQVVEYWIKVRFKDNALKAFNRQCEIAKTINEV